MKYEACSTFAFCPEICENTELFLIGKANRSSFIQTSGGLSSSLEPLRLPLVHRTGSSQQSMIKTRKSVQLWWEKCQSPSQAEFCPFLDMIKYKAVSNKILVEFLVHLTVEGCTECFTLPKTFSKIRIVYLNSTWKSAETLLKISPLKLASIISPLLGHISVRALKSFYVIHISCLSLCSGVTLISMLFNFIAFLLCNSSRHPMLLLHVCLLRVQNIYSWKQSQNTLPLGTSPHSLHIQKYRNFAAFCIKQIHVSNPCARKGPVHHQVTVFFCQNSKLSRKWDKNCKHTPVFQFFLPLWVSLGIGQTSYSMCCNSVDLGRNVSWPLVIPFCTLQKEQSWLVEDFFFSVIKNLKRRKIFQKTLYFVDRRPTKGIEALEYK